MCKLVPMSSPSTEVYREGRKIACARLLWEKLTGMKDKNREVSLKEMSTNIGGVEMLCLMLTKDVADKCNVGDQARQDNRGGSHNDYGEVVESGILKVLEGMDVRSAKDVMWILDGKLIAVACEKSFVLFQRYATYLVVRLQDTLSRWRKREESEIDDEINNAAAKQEIDANFQSEAEDMIIFDSQLEDEDSNSGCGTGEVDGKEIDGKYFEYRESTDLLKDPEVVMDDLECRTQDLYKIGG